MRLIEQGKLNHLNEEPCQENYLLRNRKTKQTFSFTVQESRKREEPEGKAMKLFNQEGEEEWGLFSLYFLSSKGDGSVVQFVNSSVVLVYSSIKGEEIVKPLVTVQGQYKSGWITHKN